MNLCSRASITRTGWNIAPLTTGFMYYHVRLKANSETADTLGCLERLLLFLLTCLSALKVLTSGIQDVRSPQSVSAAFDSTALLSHSLSTILRLKASLPLHPLKINQDFISNK